MGIRVPEPTVPLTLAAKVRVIYGDTDRMGVVYHALDRLPLRLGIANQRTVRAAAPLQDGAQRLSPIAQQADRRASRGAAREIHLGSIRPRLTDAAQPAVGVNHRHPGSQAEVRAGGKQQTMLIGFRASAGSTEK